MHPILYYPQINIEDNVQLSNAILYWDEVRIIVPGGLPQYQLSPELNYLMEREYYHLIDSLDLFQSEIMSALEKKLFNACQGYN